MNGYLAIMKSDGVAEVRRAALKVSYRKSSTSEVQSLLWDYFNKSHPRQ